MFLVCRCVGSPSLWAEPFEVRGKGRRNGANPLTLVSPLSLMRLRGFERKRVREGRGVRQEFSGVLARHASGIC